MINLKRLISINIIILVSYLLFWSFSSLVPNYFFDSYEPIIYALVSLFFAMTAIYASSIFNSFGKYFKIPALLMSLGLLCNSLGDLFWYFLGMNGDSIDYPSIADVWYILFYPITFFGIHVLFLYVSKEELRLPRLVNFIYTESVLLFLLGILISLKYTSIGFIDAFKLDLASVFDILYMLSDMFLLVHIFIILVFISNYPKAEHHLVSPLYMMGFSLFIVFIADILFGYSTEIGIYEPSGITELLYLLFVFFMSTSISRVAYSAKPKFFKM